VRDPDSCAGVRLADIGWTDVTSTTAVFAQMLRRLGYQPTITVLSVPVTYASMKNKDIDVFLGNWMPSMEGDRKSFRRGWLGRGARRQSHRRALYPGGAGVQL